MRGRKHVYRSPVLLREFPRYKKRIPEWGDGNFQFVDVGRFIKKIKKESPNEGTETLNRWVVYDREIRL